MVSQDTGNVLLSQSQMPVLTAGSSPYHSVDGKANLMRTLSDHSPSSKKSAELFFPLLPNSLSYDGTAKVPLGVSIPLQSS